MPAKIVTLQEDGEKSSAYVTSRVPGCNIAANGIAHATTASIIASGAVFMASSDSKLKGFDNKVNALSRERLLV